MGVTIQEIADKAGVSIATVSHVINKTRYVSPELCEKIEKLIVETGYDKKLSNKKQKLIMGKRSVIGVIVPNIDSTLYTRLVESLQESIEKTGRILAIYVTNNDFEYEQSLIQGIITNKRIAGIILSPISSNKNDYIKLIRSGIPFICLDRAFDEPCVPCITSDGEKGAYLATSHLINLGHTSIGLLVNTEMMQNTEKRIAGYKRALTENNIEFKEQLIFSTDRQLNDDKFDSAFHKYYESCRPSAIIALTNRLTYSLLYALKNTGIGCPNALSVIGYGEEDWCKLSDPSLSVLQPDTAEMAKLAVKELNKLMNGEENNPLLISVPTRFVSKSSTRLVSRGPFGEIAHSPDEMTFSSDDIKFLRESHFRVGISFQQSDTSLSNLYLQGISSVFDNFGINVIVVTNSHFDAELQVTQLESIYMQRPDAIVAVPVDDDYCAERFKELAKKTRLILVNSIPSEMKIGDYCSMISVNESVNGRNVATLMGEYYRNQSNIKAGLLIHGKVLAATKQRDEAVETALIEQYKNIEIVDKTSFLVPARVYSSCVEMINRHPEINTLYVSWNAAAHEVIRALKELRREDITIFTCDLDKEIGKYLASGKMIKGISAQLPFEQGVAVGKAVAKALCSENGYKYIGIDPVPVKRRGLLASWKTVLHEDAPMEIERALEDGIV